MLWAKRLESSFAGQDPVVMVENKGTTNLNSFLPGKGITSIQDRFQTVLAMKLGEVAFPLFRALVRSHVGWCGQFWAAQGNKHEGLVKKSPDQGDRDTERAGESFLED